MLDCCEGQLFNCSFVLVFESERILVTYLCMRTPETDKGGYLSFFVCCDSPCFFVIARLTGKLEQLLVKGMSSPGDHCFAVRPIKLLKSLRMECPSSLCGCKGHFCGSLLGHFVPMEAFTGNFPLVPCELLLTPQPRAISRRDAHHFHTSRAGRFHTMVAISVTIPTPLHPIGRTEDRMVSACTVTWVCSHHGCETDVSLSLSRPAFAIASSFTPVSLQLPLLHYCLRTAFTPFSEFLSSTPVSSQPQQPSKVKINSRSSLRGVGDCSPMFNAIAFPC